MSDTGTEPPVEQPDFIDWSAADQEPSKFVTNMVLLVGDSELSLLLFEVLAPYIQAPPNQPEKWTEKWMTKLPLQATCHGRFVLTPERCEQLIGLLQRQLALYWENWQLRYQEIERQKAAHQPDPEAEEEDPASAAGGGLGTMTTTQMSGAQTTQQRTARQAIQTPFPFVRTEATARQSAGAFGWSASPQEPTPDPLSASTTHFIATGEQVGQWAFRDIWLKQQMPAPAATRSGNQSSSSPPNSAATPEPAVIKEVRLIFAHTIANKLASFLDELARRSGMPVVRTVVSRRVFLSDGKTRIFVRQYISRIPEEVVEYANTSSVVIDTWIDSLPTAERLYFDDDIAVDIYWA